MTTEISIPYVSHLRIIVVPMSPDDDTVVKVQVYSIKSIVYEKTGPKEETMIDAARYITQNFPIIPVEEAKKWEARNRIIN